MIVALVPPSYFTTVLMTEVTRTEDETKYQFRTQSLAGDPAKSPAYFTDNVATPALDYRMDNDIVAVLEKLESFESYI